MLPKSISDALEIFKNSIRDDHGEPLTDEEVKAIKKEIDRLSENYNGM